MEHHSTKKQEARFWYKLKFKRQFEEKNQGIRKKVSTKPATTHTIHNGDAPDRCTGTVVAQSLWE